MTIYYLDASAWVKRYFVEPGSARILALFKEHAPFACSSLGQVEVAGTLARQEGLREKTSQSEDLKRLLTGHWIEFFAVEIDTPILELAASLAWTKRLRGADAIHLASADLLRQRMGKLAIDVILVTSDAELVVAAKSIQLEVLDPTQETRG